MLSPSACCLGARCCACYLGARPCATSCCCFVNDLLPCTQPPRNTRPQGTTFFEQETGRLERMVKGGAASQAKVEEMLKKLSVLSAFTDKPETA